MIALPEGNWFIETLTDWDDFAENKVSGRSEKVTVNRNDNPLPVKLIINK